MVHQPRHTANSLQHTATHCNTLQHTATHCNSWKYTATHVCVSQARSQGGRINRVTRRYHDFSKLHGMLEAGAAKEAALRLPPKHIFSSNFFSIWFFAKSAPYIFYKQDEKIRSSQGSCSPPPAKIPCFFLEETFSSVATRFYGVKLLYRWIWKKFIYPCLLAIWFLFTRRVDSFIEVRWRIHICDMTVSCIHSYTHQCLRYWMHFCKTSIITTHFTAQNHVGEYVPVSSLSDAFFVD